jgi:hypothetical protein
MDDERFVEPAGETPPPDPSCGPADGALVDR